MCTYMIYYIYILNIAILKSDRYLAKQRERERERFVRFRVRLGYTIGMYNMYNM